MRASQPTSRTWPCGRSGLSGATAWVLRRNAARSSDGLACSISAACRCQCHGTEHEASAAGDGGDPIGLADRGAQRCGESTIGGPRVDRLAGARALAPPAVHQLTLFRETDLR